MIDSLALQALLNGAIPKNALIASRSLDFQKTDLPILLNDVLFVPDSATAALIRISGKTGSSSQYLTINLNDNDIFSYDFNITSGIDKVLLLGNYDFFLTLFFDQTVFNGNEFTINVMYF